MKIEKLRRAVKAATEKSERAMEARMRLPAGSTRARVTSANARWMRAAEHRDLLLRQLEDAEREAGHAL